MRRCFSLLLALAAFTASSCDDKSKEQIADVIALSRNSVAFAIEGGTTTVSVATPSEWTATCSDEWVSLQRKEGHLSISVTSNLTDDVRDSQITVKTAADEQQIAIHQAFSRETILLSTTVSKEISFDSETDSYFFTVQTNGDHWDVDCEEEWIEIDYDTSSCIVKLTAQPNADKHRNATVIVTSTKGTLSKSCEVPVAQISHAENHYYQFLGYYGLHASNWYYGGSAIGVSGTGSFCTIEEKEYRKSVYIKDLFVKGTVIEATYDKQTETLIIELGQICKQEQISTTVVRSYLLVMLNMATGAFSGGALTGTLGEGYNDDADEIRKAILLSGLSSTHRTLGLIGHQAQQYVSFEDLYYATGSIYLVKWDAPATETAVTRAADGIVPIKTGFSAYKH